MLEIKLAQELGLKSLYIQGINDRDS